jgi:hypothetical protein
VFASLARGRAAAFRNKRMARGTRGQLVGRTVEVQVAEIFLACRRAYDFDDCVMVVVGAQTGVPALLSVRSLRFGEYKMDAGLV